MRGRDVDEYFGAGEADGGGSAAYGEEAASGLHASISGPSIMQDSAQNLKPGLDRLIERGHRGTKREESGQSGGRGRGTHEGD